MVRAAPDKMRSIDVSWLKDVAKKTDRRRAYLDVAALHMINLASIREIKQNMLAKYPNKEDQEGLNLNFDAQMFRPNIVIDSDEVVSISKGGRKRESGQPYCEDEIKFAKLKNGMYFRLIGPCLRCKTTSINWEKRKRDENLEPYKTI